MNTPIQEITSSDSHFEARKDASDPHRLMSEEEVIQRLASSREQAARGEKMDFNVFVSAIKEEFKL